MSTPESLVTPTAPDAAANDAESPLSVVRHSLISIKDMTLPQRAILAVGAIAILLGAILLLTSSPGQAIIDVNQTSEGQITFLPTLTFIVITPLTICALIFALAGGMASPWYIRLPLVLGVCLTLAPYPIITLTTLLSGGGATGVIDTLVELAAAGQLLIVAALAIWALAAPALRRDADDPHVAWPAWTFWIAAALTLVYFALDSFWLVVALIARLPTEKFFTYDIGTLLTALAILLGIVISWAATSLTEWGKLVSDALSSAADRIPWGLWALNTLVAVATIGIVFARGRLFEWGSLAGAAIFAGIALLLGRVARISPEWAADTPVIAVIAGAAVLYVLVQGVAAVGLAVLTALGYPDSAATDWAANGIALPQIGGAIVTALAGGGLLVWARARRPRVAAVGLYLALVGLILIPALLPQALQALGVTPPDIWSLPGLETVCALGALAISALFLARPTSRPALRATLSATVALIIGLLGVNLLLNVILPGIDALGARSTALLAALFIVGGAWDLATSGADITNGASRRFPRSVRLLLYLAYTMIAAVILVYATLQTSGTGQPAPQYLNDSELVPVALIALGIPAVLHTYLLRVGRSGGWLSAGRANQPAS